LVPWAHEQNKTFVSIRRTRVAPVVGESEDDSLFKNY
jgi:hypothetical protein